MHGELLTSTKIDTNAETSARKHDNAHTSHYAHTYVFVVPPRHAPLARARHAPLLSRLRARASTRQHARAHTHAPARSRQHARASTHAPARTRQHARAHAHLPLPTGPSPCRPTLLADALPLKQRRHSSTLSFPRLCGATSLASHALCSTCWSTR
eukprot:4518813-Pleurochrysis_carterae.AAC.6